MYRPSAPVRLTILGVGIVYTALLYLSGVELDNPYKRLVAVLPAIGTIGVTFWDVLLWRLPAINRFIQRPRIDGLWHVELTPTTDSQIPAGGNRGPISGYFVISQSYWSIQVRQYTTESASRSRAFFWERAPGANIECLTFVYENEPKQRHQHRSGRHFGTCIFDIASREPVAISGMYFTDRYTKGDMQLQLVDRSKGYASFQEAEQHANRAP